MRNLTLTLILLLGLTILATTTYCQEITGPPVFQSSAANLIVPQSRTYSLSGSQQPVQITGVTTEVRILQQIATTTIDVALANPTNRTQESEMLIPVPEGAVVRAFTFEGSSKEPTAKLLPKAEAQAIYRSIVAKLRDPALLEFAGYSVIRSSVFPISAGGKQTGPTPNKHTVENRG